MRARDGFQNIPYFFDVAAIRYADMHLQATVCVVQNPVGDPPGDEFSIRNQDILVIECFNLGRTNSNAAYEAFNISDCYKIAGPDGTLKQ